MVEVPAYDGITDVHEYVDKARIYISQFNDESEYEKVRLLSTGLTGIARELYKSYKSEKKGTITVSGLLRMLKGVCKSSRLSATKELHSIEQGEKESFREFGVRVLSAVKSLGRNWTPEELDKATIGYLREGARECCAKALANKRPRDFLSALRYGREAEEAEEKDKAKKGGKGKAKSHNDRIEDLLNNITHGKPVPGPPPKQAVETPNTGAKGELDALLARLRKLEEESDRRYTRGTRERRGRRDESHLTCFHCKGSHGFEHCVGSSNIPAATKEEKDAIRLRVSHYRAKREEREKREREGTAKYVLESSIAGYERIVIDETVLGPVEAEVVMQRPSQNEGGLITSSREPTSNTPNDVFVFETSKLSHAFSSDSVSKINDNNNSSTSLLSNPSFDVQPDPPTENDRLCVAMDKASECAKIPLTMAGLKAEGLLDTGAGYNYTSKKMVEAILRENRTRITITACNAVATLADSTSVAIHAKAVIPIVIDDLAADVEFYVMSNLVFDCILGLKFCVKHHMLLDPVSHSAFLGRQTQKPVLQSIDTITVAPYTEQAVAVVSVGTKQGTCVVDNNCSVLGTEGLVVARGLLDVKDDGSCHRIVVANMSEVPATIKAGDILCHVEMINMDNFELTEWKEPTYAHTCATVLAGVKTKLKTKAEALQQLEKRVPGISLNTTTLTDIQVCQVVELVLKYEHIFSTKIDAADGGAVGVQHEINTGDAQPFNLPPHRCSHSERQKIDNMTAEMCSTNIASPSSSPWGSPVVLTPKADGTTRFCVDYRKLNSLTVRDVYPLPRIEDCLSALGGNEYFSSLDLSSGYWQIPMAEKDKQKTAFITPSGLYEFNVLPFGLTNAPATFQRYMDKILAGLKWQCLLVYLDDVCVYSKAFESHMIDLENTFKRIEQYRVKLKPGKCRLFQQEFLYLGHVVTRQGLRTNPLKISGVQQMSAPRNASQLRSFIGLCSYYRRFIRNCATLSGPLNKLIGNNVKFVWTAVEEEAFQRLKWALIDAPMLTFPDYSVPFVIQTDACDEGIGAVLSQIIEKKERVIEYRSRALQPAEKPWAVREKEALAIIYACETFRPYVYGTKFTIETDHHSLQWLMKATSPARLVRWALRLSEFDFEIKYKRGSSNGNADGLSRNPVHSIQMKDDSDGVTSLETMLLLASVQLEGFEPNTNVLAAMLNTVRGRLNNIDKEELRMAQRNDPNLKLPIDKCLSGEKDTEGMVITDDLLYLEKNGKKLLVIPWNLIERVLSMYHNEASAAHLSRDRLYDHLKNRFYWYGMYADASRWVKACHSCQAVKMTRPLNHGLLHPIEVSRPFEVLGMDIVGHFPKTEEGYTHVLVCVDLFTSWVEAGPLRGITAQEVCGSFKRLVLARHGCPEAVLTDKGVQFESKLFQEMCDVLKIRHLVSAAYHHQTNGKVERFNKFIENGLAQLVNADQKNWSQQLDNVLMAYRMSVGRVTGENPFFLMYGRDPILPQDLRVAGISLNQRHIAAPTLQAYKDNLVDTLQRAHNTADIAKRKEQEHYKEYYDKTQKDVRYSPGDRVMRHVPAPKVGVSYKLAPHWEGPYTVETQVNPGTYRIAMQTERKMVRVDANVREIRPANEWENARIPKMN